MLRNYEVHHCTLGWVMSWVSHDWPSLCMMLNIIGTINTIPGCVHKFNEYMYTVWVVERVHVDQLMTLGIIIIV